MSDEETKLQEETKSRFQTKHYILILVVAVVAVASITAVFQVSPNNNTAFVPEGGIYAVGEKMTYDYDILYEYPTTNTETNIDRTEEIEVLDFDGENYTINKTSCYQEYEISATWKANLRGQMLGLIGLEEYPLDPENTTSLFPLSGATNVKFLSEDVSVGDSWDITLDRQTENGTVEGTINYKLSEITTVTVPAGTYEVLKIEAELPNFRSNSSIGEVNIHTEMSISGYILLEKGTYIPIEYETIQLATTDTGSTVIDCKTTEQMQLTQHTK